MTLTRTNLVIAFTSAVVTIGLLGFGLGQVKGPASPTARASRMSSDLTSASGPGGNGVEYLPVTPTPTPAPTASDPTKPPDVGATLASLTLRSGSGRLVASWQLAGVALDQVRVTITGDDGSHPASTCTPTVIGCTFTDLVNGVDYAVDLSVAGPSPQHRTVHAIPYPAVLGGKTARLWLDPAAPGALVTKSGPVAAGAAVRRMNDRSATGSDAQALPDRAPPTITMIHGHPALQFGYTRGLAFPAAGLPTGSAPSTVYAVAAYDTATPDNDCFSSVVQWGLDQFAQMRALLKGCSTAMAYADTFGTWSQASATLAWHSGQVQVMRADFTANQISVWMNGSASYTWQLPAGTQLSTARTTDGMVGAARWATDGGWPGRIAEVIVLSGVPSPDDDAAITQYLRHKWGM
ncbi:MAG TPA: hypothetical protein VFP72_21030 [Kineosporiaceae bacterium]|nr:hypothetical protein [Kineosporiaceae bacterium]